MGGKYTPANPRRKKKNIEFAHRELGSDRTAQKTGLGGKIKKVLASLGGEVDTVGWEENLKFTGRAPQAMFKRPERRWVNLRN